jgi:pseudaminic acid synthase
MATEFKIKGQTIGINHPCYIVAEISANHNQNIETALKLIDASKAAGADAVKLQTYTADTITLNSEEPWFQIKNNSQWSGQTLYQLYQQAYTPWEWHPQLFQKARDLKLTAFSSPFDFSAVDFLEQFDPPAYKIASFEFVDLPLIAKVAKLGKPMILSTGMSTEDEIHEAIQTIRDAGNDQILILKCVSSYPAKPEEMNLRCIPTLMERFNVPVGLSDHTLGTEVASLAVSLGACMIEKHITLNRIHGGPDSAFSLEPQEFNKLIQSVRQAELILGQSDIKPTPSEKENLIFRRSLFIVKDVKKGEQVNEENTRSIRPGNGLHTRHYTEVLGKNFTRDISMGTPLSWDMIDTGNR